MKSKQIQSALFGVAVGDALGVPVEFESRESLKNNPVTNMREFGTYYQPIGTWSDDSSLTFCLAESLIYGYDVADIATNFVKWHNSEIWTPHGSVFDIGIATRQALSRLGKGYKPELCGGFEEEDNGNGSLMRILPLAFYLKGEKNNDVIYKTVKEVSSITHAHFRSVFACFIYVVYSIELIKGFDKEESYNNMKVKINDFLNKNDFNKNEISVFDRILKNEIHNFDEDTIQSSGYVLHSLEASFWCFLNSETYEETVLKAVNLGEDTDTTGAIAGGLAGVYYGFENIPKEWIDVIVRKNDILELSEKLENKLNS